jgi:DNA-binding phage protein
MANIVEIESSREPTGRSTGFTAPIKSLKDLEVAAGKVAPLFIGIATAAEAAFLAMAKHFINTADEMGKMAQKAGTTTETFSRMAYAGNLAGVSAESLKNGFKFLNRAISISESRLTGNTSAFQRPRDYLEGFGRRNRSGCSTVFRDGG